MNEEQKQAYVAELYKKFTLAQLIESSIPRTENIVKIICAYGCYHLYQSEIHQLLRELANSPADGQKLEDYKFKTAFANKSKVEYLCSQFDHKNPQACFHLLKEHRNTVEDCKPGNKFLIS